MFKIENMLTKNNLVYGAMTIFGYMTILLFPINLLFVYVLSRAHLRSHENNDILESIQQELNDLYEFSQHTCYNTAKFVKHKISEFKNRGNSNDEFNEFVNLGNMNSGSNSIEEHTVEGEGDTVENINEGDGEDHADEDHADEDHADEEDDNVSNEAVNGDRSSGSSADEEDESSRSELYKQSQAVADGE